MLKAISDIACWEENNMDPGLRRGDTAFVEALEA